MRAFQIAFFLGIIGILSIAITSTMAYTAHPWFGSEQTGLSDFQTYTASDMQDISLEGVSSPDDSVLLDLGFAELALGLLDNIWNVGDIITDIFAVHDENGNNLFAPYAAIVSYGCRFVYIVAIAQIVRKFSFQGAW